METGGRTPKASQVSLRRCVPSCEAMAHDDVLGMSSNRGQLGIWDELQGIPKATTETITVIKTNLRQFKTN